MFFIFLVDYIVSADELINNSLEHINGVLNFAVFIKLIDIRVIQHLVIFDEIGQTFLVGAYGVF